MSKNFNDKNFVSEIDRKMKIDNYIIFEIWSDFNAKTFLLFTSDKCTIYVDIIRSKSIAFRRKIILQQI